MPCMMPSASGCFHFLLRQQRCLKHSRIKGSAMLPLRPFVLEKPRDMASLKALLVKADIKTKIVAGGTDLVPNLKHGLYDVNTLISLAAIDELKAIELSPR